MTFFVNLTYIYWRFFVIISLIVSNNVANSKSTNNFSSYIVKNSATLWNQTFQNLLQWATLLSNWFLRYNFVVNYKSQLADVLLRYSGISTPIKPQQVLFTAHFAASDCKWKTSIFPFGFFHSSGSYTNTDDKSRRRSCHWPGSRARPLCGVFSPTRYIFPRKAPCIPGDDPAAERVVH